MSDRTTADGDGGGIAADGTAAARAEPSDARWMSVEDVRELYATRADRMARLDPINRLFTGRYRRSLFGTARGRVLDVACGTGLNLQYLPESVEYVGVDVSPAMLEKARERAARLDRGATFREMDAQDLAVPDDEFETVISSLSTCTFPDPAAALREMGRVCDPGGRILLLEHGRSDVGPIARFQDWGADAHYEREGCRWNQEPVDLVSLAGLSIRNVVSGTLGIVTAIEATPDGGSGR